MDSVQAARLLWESGHAVCLSGREMIMDDGIDSMRNMTTAYEIEMKYGYSPEEIFSAQFFINRTEIFYRFYREEVLAQDKEPGQAFLALAEMERVGVLRGTITRQLYNFPKRAGCQNVFNLHGNIYEKNCCPRCGREYTVEYLKTAGKVPLCEKCKTPVHPGVRLLGEMVDIGLITKAAYEVSRADTLLLAGTNMRSEAVEQFLHYYKGKKVILIHEKEHFADRDADYVMNGRTSVILPEIAQELKKLAAQEEAAAGAFETP